MRADRRLTLFPLRRHGGVIAAAPAGSMSPRSGGGVTQDIPGGYTVPRDAALSKHGPLRCPNPNISEGLCFCCRCTKLPGLLKHLAHAPVTPVAASSACLWQRDTARHGSKIHGRDSGVLKLIVQNSFRHSQWGFGRRATLDCHISGADSLKTKGG